MNRENKAVRTSATIVRILLAVSFVVFGFSYFFTPSDKMPMDLSTSSGQFMAALFNTGYFLPFLKMTEGIAGLLLFFKRWTPFSLLVLAPIVINIALVNFLLAPVNTFGVIISIIILLFTSFVAWYNWAKYAPLFAKEIVTV